MGVFFHAVVALVGLLAGLGLAAGSQPSVAWSPYGPIVGTNGNGNSQQGSSVALSGSGVFLAVGGPADNPGAGWDGFPLGAVWVFRYAKATKKWVQQGPKLVITDQEMRLFGKSVSLDYEGRTLVVGGWGYPGGAFVFVRNARNVWVRNRPKLVDPGAGNGPDSGTGRVVMNSGGTLIAMGSPDDGPGGSVYLYGRSKSGVWKLQPWKLRARGVQLGLSLALDAKGRTLVAGSPPGAFPVTSLVVFSYSPAKRTWLPGVKLTVRPSDRIITDVGISVAISADGNTVGSAGAVATPGPPGALVWVRDSAGRWSRQGPVMVGNRMTGFSSAYSVALSANGSVMALGVPTDGYSKLPLGSSGSTVMFKRSRFLVWTQRGIKLRGRGDKTGTAQVGAAVALDSAANTVAMGGPVLANSQGGTWVFRQNVIFNGR